MTAASAGFGAVPLAYAKGTESPPKGWRSTWRPAEGGRGVSTPSSSSSSPPVPAAPSSKATLPPPTKGVPRKAAPGGGAGIAAPFSRYPRKEPAFPGSSLTSSSSQSPSLPFPANSSYAGSNQQNQQQIPVVYRSAPYRREAEREKSDFGDLKKEASSSSLTPRVLFVDDGGGARARLAAALFAAALAEAPPAATAATTKKKNGNSREAPLPRLLPRIEFAAASVGPPARGPPDEAVVAAAQRAGVADFFARGGAATCSSTLSSSPSSSSPSPSRIEEADLVRADLCLVCDRYDAEDLLRDAAALDGVSPGAFYSARVRKLSAFAPAAPEWLEAARAKSRGGLPGSRSGSSKNGAASPLFLDDDDDAENARENKRTSSSFSSSSSSSAAALPPPPPLFLEPSGDIDDPLYGISTSSFSAALALRSNDDDDGEENELEEEEESELSAALDATVAQLRLATRGLLQFLLSLEERRHRGRTGDEGSRDVASGGGTPPLPQQPPLPSLHASLRQAILCPLLSPEAERGGRGPAAAVSIMQAKAAGWRPVWQEEREEEEEEEEDAEGEEFLSFPSPSSSTTTTTTTTTTALFTLKTSKDGRQIIYRKHGVRRGHWSSVENVDRALLRFIERKRKKIDAQAKRSSLGPSSISSSSSSSSSASPSSSSASSTSFAPTAAAGLSQFRRKEAIPPTNEAPAPPPPFLLFPTQAELRAAGETSVAKAANNAGGLAAAARRLGFQPSYRARGSWQDFEALAQELREAARAISDEENKKKRGGVRKEAGKRREQPLLPMPTQAQLRAAGKGALIHSIQRHGGTKEVAERAGLRFGEKRGRPPRPRRRSTAEAEEVEEGGGEEEKREGGEERDEKAAAAQAAAAATAAATRAARRRAAGAFGIVK